MSVVKINSDVKLVTCNGKALPVKAGSVKGNFGGVTRNEVMGGKAPLGFTETGAVGMCSFTVVWRKGFDKDILDVTDAQIRIQWNAGADMVMSGAFLVNQPDFAAGEGDLEVEYRGNPWQVTKLG